MTREEWKNDFLGAVNAPITKRNSVAVIAWIASEGGNASWNPLNTTKPMDGDNGPYNLIGVRNYASHDQGLAATVATIHEHGKGYEHILARLRANRWPSATLKAVYDSSWGTVRLPFLLRSVKRSYAFYADQPIAQ